MLRQEITLLCSAREGLKQISQLRVAQSEERGHGHEHAVWLQGMPIFNLFSPPNVNGCRIRAKIAYILERIPLRFEHSLHGERSSCTLLPRNRQRSVRSSAIDAEWCARRPCAGQPSLC